LIPYHEIKVTVITVIYKLCSVALSCALTTFAISLTKKRLPCNWLLERVASVEREGCLQTACILMLYHHLSKVIQEVSLIKLLHTLSASHI